MKKVPGAALVACFVTLMSTTTGALAAGANEAPGRDLASLLDYARQNNPEVAAMRHEADASAERVTPAGALPDPRLRVELMDITRMGEQNATLSPSRVGSTKYTLSQEVP